MTVLSHLEPSRVGTVSNHRGPLVTNRVGALSHALVAPEPSKYGTVRPRVIGTNRTKITNTSHVTNFTLATLSPSRIPCQL